MVVLNKEEVINKIKEKEDFNLLCLYPNSFISKLAILNYKNVDNIFIFYCNNNKGCLPKLIYFKDGLKQKIKYGFNNLKYQWVE